jgi:macrolide transport system ATP-binding/permease protein
MARLATIIRMRLRSLVSRVVVEQELDEELQYHLDRQIDENVAAGMSPREARWAALRAIGDFEQRKEECRDQRGLNMFDNLINDIRFALRQLRKDVEFTATAIAMLALGICASVAIFAFVDAALLKPLPYKDPARLLGVYEKIDPWCPYCNLSWPDYLDWKKQNTTLNALDVYRGTGYEMTTPTGLQPVTAARVSDGFFRTLGVTPMMGRDFYSGEDRESAPRAVILSYGAWQKRFGGDRNVIGQTVVLDKIPNVIVGVLPREFHFAPAGPREIWSSYHPEDQCDLRRGCHSLYGVGRLKDGVSLEAAQSNFVSIAQQLEKQYPDSNRNQGAAVRMLSESIVGQIRPVLFVLLAGAGLLLLIGYVNVTGLMLVRSENRRREMAVRTALGASPGRLAIQFVTEALILIGAGGVLGLAAASWLMQALVKFRSLDVVSQTPFLNDLGLNFRILTFAGLIALLGAVLFSITPSLRMWSPEIRDGLEGARGSAGTVWRKVGSKLVVLELATAVVLLVSAGLLAKSLDRLLRVDLGLDPSRLITMQVAAPQERFAKAPQAVALARQMVDRLQSAPGVKAAGIVSNGLPLEGNGNTDWIRVLGRPWHGEHLEMPNRGVTPGYFAALGAKLVRGRYFTESEDGSKPKVAIINQAFARVHFPNEDPLGKQLAGMEKQNPIPIEIVGIVEDIREGPLDNAIPPVLYRPYYQDWDTFLSVVVRTSQDDVAIGKTLTAAIQGIDPELVTVSTRTMTERIQESPSAYIHRSVAWLVGGFAGLAMVMGLVGLYGVIAYSVSQRTREIGVRMALGAVPGAVYRMILREAGWLTLSGIAIGLVCAVTAANLARNLLFGITPWDVPTLVSIALVLGVAALAASFIPARRAARVNPVEALRAE